LQTHQCSGCFSVDQTAKKVARAAKNLKNQAPAILPLILEYLAQPDAVAPPVAPFLSEFQLLSPPALAVAPRTPTSAAGELNSKTPKSAAVKNPKPLGHLHLVQKRLHDDLDVDSSSDDSHHRARHKLPLPIPSRADLAALQQKLQVKMDALQQKRQKLSCVKSRSSSASDDTTSCDEDVEDEDVKTSKDRLPRITAEERSCVCDWIAKDRKDGKMNNGRWIRNGGAKGATMTATSSEVKTSGAYEALAV
jgi:hypothetical protein